jgi:pentapeptide MXKDX repeat protein
MPVSRRILGLAACLAFASPAIAQTASTMSSNAMNHDSMSSPMTHDSMGASTMKPATHAAPAGTMSHSTMSADTMKPDSTSVAAKQ